MSTIIKNLTFTSDGETLGDIHYWREQILNVVLTVAAFMGGAVYFVNILQLLSENNLIFVGFYTVVYTWILVITIFRRVSYTLRAGTLMALLFLVGLVSALQFASVGDVRVWWLGLSILTTVFFGTGAGVGMSIFSTVTYLIIGWLMNNYMITTPILRDYIESSGMYPWTSTSVPFVTVSLLVVISFGIIFNGLRSNLKKATDLTAELEQDRIQLQQRTSVLERREVQIRTAAEISRTISAELDPNKIFQQVVELVKERFDLYYVGVFMLDDSKKFAVLRVGSGEAGHRMVADGHILAVGGTSMIGWAISNRQARIALDVGEDAVHFQNPHLPLTRSELALPMISEDKVLGAMSIQSIRPEAFDQDDITVLQGIADSLATAIENANLFNQIQDNLEEIQSLHRQYLAKTWEEVIIREGEMGYTAEDNFSISPLPPVTESKKMEVSLILRDQSIGTITIERNLDTWTPDEEAFVSNVAQQTALALENARLVNQTERGAQYNRSVTDITSKVWSSTSVDTIMQTALQELGNTLGATDGLILLHPPKGQAKKY
jgi:GAF domain-containing protein